MRPAADFRPDLEQAVRSLVARELGEPAVELRPLLFGQASRSYDVRLRSGRAVIVRTTEKPSRYAGTVANLRTLRGLGLPVPIVLAADVTGSASGVGYLVTAKIPGRDLGLELDGMTAAQLDRLAGRLVAIQRRVGAALSRGAGYGHVPIGAPGTDEHWRGVLERYLDRSARLAQAHRAGSWTVEATRRVRAATAGLDAELAGVAPTCFLDDLTVKNVLVEDGELRGLVDFDTVCYGDPLHWLALVDVAVTAHHGDLGRGYVRALRLEWGVRPEDEPRYALSCATHVVDFLAQAPPAAPWRPLLRRALERWLARAVGATLG